MQQRYRTKQREKILACLCAHKNECLSIAELRTHLADEGTAVGEATCYRTLNFACEQGIVKRYAPAAGRAATYQYASQSPECDNHFHLKCALCGKLYHTDCEELSSLSHHLEQKHGFHIDCASTVFYGECSLCKHNKSPH